MQPFERESDPEPESEVEQLKRTILGLEDKNRTLTNEFDNLWTKMRALHLQKENELTVIKEEKASLQNEVYVLKKDLDYVRNQSLAADYQLRSDLEEEKRKASEQILSLECLIQESNNGQSWFSAEVERLKSANEKLQSDYRDLKSTIAAHGSPKNEASKNVTFGSLTRAISDVFNQTDKDKFDNELCKSILEPLEEEVRQLKEKLRTTDEELQKYQNRDKRAGSSSNDIAGAEPDQMNCSSCDKCEKLAQLLREEEEKCGRYKEDSESLEAAIKRQTNDLETETAFREQIAEKWESKERDFQNVVTILTNKITKMVKEFDELKEKSTERFTEIMDQLIQVTQDRELAEEYLKDVKLENDHLMGKFERHSNDLRAKRLEIQKLDDWQAVKEYLVRQEDELIKAKVGQEAYCEEIEKMRAEKSRLQEKIVIFEGIEIQLNKKIELLNNKLNSDRMAQQIKKYKKEFEEIHEKLEKMSKEKEEADKLSAELKSKVSNLQNDLETSEIVQKDFVRLSQSLQVQLEKIRTADTQVRWQYEDDVDQCQACQKQFADNSTKINCRHCGQIMCALCLSKTVYCGRNNRETKVCDVCYTLLVKSSAPYFSNEVPKSPK